jgi:hypothetical protein
MMTVTEHWTILSDFITRMVALSIHTICLLLVGALMGAWIVHLTESPQVQQHVDPALVAEMVKSQGCWSESLRHASVGR